jgi:ribosome-binding ATPase YchF (GTP1/OBG family)
MKDIGIAGLPYSGKTTLFQALTLSGSAGGRSNQAVVDVADARLEVLARIERSRKVVAAKVRFVDVPGGLTARGIAEYRQTDALCIVVRAFGVDADPIRELSSVQDELLLADLASLESGRDRAAKRARGTPEAKAELDVLERAYAVVESGRALRDTELEDDALKLLRGYGALTLKPQVVVANVEEGAGPPEGLEDGIAISAALEAEVAGMEPAEALELLQGFGVTERGLDRVITSGYRALDLVTFLTTGEDETRAWEVRRGATAPEAAGQIHSDLERGFIRAEVVSYDDLVAAGSWAKAKEKGVLRVEGKDYAVKEGDVINVRFAV